MVQSRYHLFICEMTEVFAGSNESWYGFVVICVITEFFFYASRGTPG